ncbi:hypothetical protein BGZ57DRAFT_862241 [Hyaloscypha finlandica]|nr:hypothetical protein BGZ57DRAFT_862241 [Hyaloscypha finlandica]
MSGAEAGFVIGLISGVILIIELEAFRQVAVRLPLVIEILRSAKERASALEEMALEALEHTLESCKAKAENLKKIFQKVIWKDDDKWYNQYKEALMLIYERLKGTAIETQVKEIKEAIKQMNEMPSSLPDEARAVQMPPVPNRDDINITWNYLRVSIKRIM